MVVVKVQPGESADLAYKKFSRKVAAEGILQEVRERERFIKPSRRRYEAEQQERKRKRRQK